MPAHILQRNPNDQSTFSNPFTCSSPPFCPQTYAESTIDSLFVNGTSAAISQGYVGILGTTAKTLISTTASTPQFNPIVVAGGFASTGYAAGQNVPVARSGSEALVNVTGTVSVGDVLVTSTTAGSATRYTGGTPPPIRQRFSAMF